MDIASFLASTGSYTHGYSSTVSDAAVDSLVTIITIFFLLFVAIAYVVMAFLISRMFKKAGEKNWKAWVPIYNNWVLLELGGQKGFWAILAFIPAINIIAAIFMYIAYYNIGLKLGKEGAFVLLAIFVPIVWFIWLAVDDSTWRDKPGAQTTPVAKA